MDKTIITDGLKAAAPIMAGYVVLGLPCGLLCGQAGLDWLQVLIMSLVFYSGAGQYMIPNMWLAAASIPSIIASVSLVNARQMLYSASLARFCENAGRPLAFLFGATVTDESFGVNLARFEEGSWDVQRATCVNLFSETTWAVANVIGVLVGTLLAVPTALASFAMTAIFICLLCMQKICASNVIAAIGAVTGVIICKLIGLGGPAIFLGSLVGISAGFVYSSLHKHPQSGEDS